MRYPRPALLVLLTGCLGLFGGCGSPTSPNAIMDRVDAHRDEYETWPYEIKESVLSGRVMRGMDPTMVLVARGNPDKRVDRGNGDEVWIYRVRGENSSGGPLLPGGGQITLGGGSPGYPGSYPGGSGIYLPPIVLGGGGGGQIPADEEEIVFHNGRVTHGDGVK